MLQETKSKFKKVNFQKLSIIKCEDCGQLLKVNLVRNKNAKRCYVCFKISKGKKMLKNGKWDLLASQSKNVHSFGTDLQKKDIAKLHKRLNSN